MEPASRIKLLRCFDSKIASQQNFGIIAGRPLNLQGQRGDICMLTESILRSWLTGLLASFPTALLLKDERYTSQYADMVLDGARERRDETAAALLLQEYLDYCTSSPG